MVVGVLALQGAYAKHIERLAALDVSAIEVRTSQDLQNCQALIFPGGESTTMTKLIRRNELRDPLIDFAKDYPVFGTCAGCILMAGELVDEGHDVEPFGWLPIKVRRNGYGRQLDSFKETISVSGTQVPATFIRAPRIEWCAPQIEILATHNDEPVLVRHGHFLAATFHPELTHDLTIHHLFLKSCYK